MNTFTQEQKGDCGFTFDRILDQWRCCCRDLQCCWTELHADRHTAAAQADGSADLYLPMIVRAPGDEALHQSSVSEWRQDVSDDLDSPTATHKTLYKSSLHVL